MKSNTTPSPRRVCALIFLAVVTLASTASAQTLPTFDKSFSPSTIGPGGVSTLRFNIAGGPTRGLAFTDTLPAGVTIASPANATSGCAGSLSAPAGGGTITFSGGEVAGSCSITVDVTSSTAGTHTNTTGDLTSGLGNSGTATANLTVVADRPGFSKSFSPSSVFFGGRSTLTFTIDNSANLSLMFNLTFSDTLPSGMIIAGPANASTTCGGGIITAPAGGSVISYGRNFSVPPPDASVAAGAVCTVKVDVIGNSVGELVNTSGELTSTPNGSTIRSSGSASASLTVTGAGISVTKTFTDDPVAPGGTVTLAFTVRNLSRSDTATNINFTDNLDSTLSGLVATGLPAAACGGTLSGAGVITLSGATVASEGTCTFSVTLQVPASAATGSYVNTTSSITADLGAGPVAGDPASDVLFVAPIPLLTKTFLDAGTLTPDPLVGTGGQVVIRFSITNTSASSSATAIAFIDELTTFLPFPITASLPASPCGGSMSLISLGTDRQGLSLTGGSLAPAASCTFDVTLDIPVSNPGGNLTRVNLTEEITATVDGETLTGNPATDSFELVATPRLTKAFTDDPASPGDTVTLRFELRHEENAPADATGITFSDDLTSTLSGLTAVGLPNTSDCGGGSQITGTTNLTFSGGTLAPGEECAFSVTLQVPAAAPSGRFSNTTSNVMASVLGVAATGLPGSDDLRIGGLTFTKEFIDDPVLPGGSVTLRFTIDNTSSTASAASITFTDDLDDALDNLAAATGSVPQSNICGTGSSLTGTSGNRLLTFTGGSLAANTSCTFDVTLDVPPGAEDGTYINTTSALSATFDGIANTPFDAAIDRLTVDSNFLSISKEFTNDPVSPGGTVNLRFTISNLDTAAAAADLAFTDDLDATLAGLFATGLPAAACGGTLSGSSVISLTGGTLAAGASCTIDVSLSVPTGIAIGTVITNTTGEVTGTIGGLAVAGGVATDTLKINFLSFSKSFDGPAVAGTSALLTFAIENLNASTSIVGLELEDNLNAVLSGLVATGLPVNDVCGTGSVLSGTSNVTLSGGSLLPAGSCTFNVTVQVPASAVAGTYLNTTSNLRQFGTAVAPPATAMLTVGSAADLSLTKSDSPDPVTVGGLLIYTLTVENAGPSDATGVVVTDTLPAEVTLVSTSGCAEDANGVPICSLGTVAAGGSASYTVTVTVDVGEGVITNTASVASDTSDPDTANNSATEDTLVVAFDSDGDGVPNGVDLCSGTVIPEGVPTVRLGTNRFALVDGDGIFDTTPPNGNGPGVTFTIEDTAGCSCEQIIEAQGLGQGHVKFGCSKGAMENWIGQASAALGALTAPAAIPTLDSVGLALLAVLILLAAGRLMRRQQTRRL